MSSPATSAPAWEQYRALLAAYAHARVNYDYEQVHEYSSATGWRIDHYVADLPAEAPGPPAEAGSFAAAQVVMRRYAFPPPDLITGYFDPGQPLDKRIMVLRAHFLVFNFYFGVRVVDVVDAAAQASPAGPERVWGYGYRTLEGHFEKGQINFSVHKNLATGAVQFRIQAMSQPGHIRNPFYWLGFKLLGRMLQRRFGHQSLARMRRLVAEALAHPAAPAQTKPGAGS
ncbi:DUF1990 family protein [Hymenobacter cheonanensis]|uniref:DUF1990 family protein n=1 Tax=Hymenobacter sp. CA2-7 TaxID=3063993 RepID=UPI002713E662|nr:DUF1990 family protein [Hymenobacter sp. CA2-7]MDO7886515.1 DUF1990 family protein [Hymenobacter sp. CA2-7]